MIPEYSTEFWGKMQPRTAVKMVAKHFNFCYHEAMTITWFGHSCFRIEAKEGSILIDPFDKKIGLKPPRLKDDLVLVTHEHYDHNNLEGVTGEELVIRGPGEYERKGMAVQGISSYHDNTQGSERGFNNIYRITAEDVVLCHLSGKMRMNFIKILPGDRVKLEMTPYDKTKGRITYRYK